MSRFLKAQSETLDLGNNERKSRGLFPQSDGRFLALTFSQSRWFATRKGAVRWLAARGIVLPVQS